MKIADENQRSRHYEEERKWWENNAVARKLLDSGALATAVRLLEGRRRVQRRHSQNAPLDIWIVRAATGAARERDLVDRMTASERKKLEITIRESADALEGALALFHGEAGFSYHFQSEFDLLALNAACNHQQWCQERDVPMDEETTHRCRYAIYFMLMYDLDEFFDAIRRGADWFSWQETIIKKPNDKNANRLHFIRKLNNSLCSEFDSPCRSAALAITSAFFDCSDLDEAALSKLAPRHQAKPYVMPQDDGVEAESKSENPQKSSAE
jgi:hypothetical protein